MTRETIVVSVPTEVLRDDTSALLGEDVAVEFVVWDGGGDPPRSHFDIVVPLNYRQPDTVPNLAKVTHGFVQSMSNGYEGVEERIHAGVTWANARSVHETATAEQAVALMLVAQRGFDGIIRRQDRRHWERFRTPGLADRRVMILGYGGIGKAIEERLEGFEVEVVRVASRARIEDGKQVHGISEIEELLPSTDILAIVLPGGRETYRLVGDRMLSLLPDGALVVNVGRGTIVDTDALVDHVSRGRIRVASDVFDPEPLPPEHPLWSLEGAIIAPHMGGSTPAGPSRMARLLALQIRRVAQGEQPVNVVFTT